MAPAEQRDLESQYRNLKSSEGCPPGHLLATFGACLQMVPLLGIVLSIISMLGVFSEMSQGEPSSAELFSESISLSLLATGIGIIAAIAGIPMLLIALFVYRYRAAWFYSFLLVYAILCLLGLPIGTLLGICILIYIIPRKDEFFPAKQTQSEPAS